MFAIQIKMLSTDALCKSLLDEVHTFTGEITLTMMFAQERLNCHNNNVRQKSWAKEIQPNFFCAFDQHSHTCTCLNIYLYLFRNRFRCFFALGHCINAFPMERHLMPLFFYARGFLSLSLFHLFLNWLWFRGLFLFVWTNKFANDLCVHLWIYV